MPEIQVKESITINRKAVDIYRFWRSLENLPRFIDHENEIITGDHTDEEGV